MNATRIAPLNLTSDPDLTRLGGIVTEQWFGFFGPANSVVWGKKPVSPRYGTADYTCVVSLPAMTVGSREDRDSDISAALGRHLDRSA